MTIQTASLKLMPDNMQRLSNLCGRLNENIKQIESSLELTITQRGNTFLLSGSQDAISNGCLILESLYNATESGALLNSNLIHLTLREYGQGTLSEKSEDSFEEEQKLLIKTPKASVKPRGSHQNSYVPNIRKNDINFGIGPAGTGKTYVAVAKALSCLLEGKVNKIVLSRPAVEAGEKLGFFRYY